MHATMSSGGTVRHGARLINDLVQWEEIKVTVVKMEEESETMVFTDDGDEEAGQGGQGQGGQGSNPSTPVTRNTAAAKRRSSKKEVVRHTGKVTAFNRKTGMHTISLTTPETTNKPFWAFIANKPFSCWGNNTNNNSKQGGGDSSSAHGGATTVLVDLHSVRYFVVVEQGPLQHLLHYDLFCFFFVCVLAALLLLGAHLRGSLKHGWQLRAVLMGMQVGYSLCAFPFVCASIEPWKWVVTHARATGYNRVGVCVTRLAMLRENSFLHRVLLAAAS
jgi:hypothetical protein